MVQDHNIHISVLLFSLHIRLRMCHVAYTHVCNQMQEFQVVSLSVARTPTHWGLLKFNQRNVGVVRTAERGLWNCDAGYTPMVQGRDVTADAEMAQEMTEHGCPAALPTSILVRYDTAQWAGDQQSRESEGVHCAPPPPKEYSA
uniref:Uncharacterized protein n=1 Tax=Eutreptiella gymnastica TaxID=73025 RepID=A0A7S4FU79_9EUGL|mmetsp:Transcript_19174/g.30635  ORF Transcript_19174/g.30635 Transcript_19174/m.30635 type:complete len:144 (+) Transcript_19174:1115-1546(+)